MAMSRRKIYFSGNRKRDGDPPLRLVGLKIMSKEKMKELKDIIMR